MRTKFSLLASGTLCALASLSFAQDGRLFLDEAPLDKVVDFPKEKLAAYFQQMTKEQIGVIRLLEGGLYNVNIRHDENATPDNYTTEFHEDTIDVWVDPRGLAGRSSRAARRSTASIAAEASARSKSATWSSSRPASTTA